MKRAIVAAAMLGFAAFPAMADEDDITRLESDADVSTTGDRLAEAVEGAGAKVLARIDHGAGARSVDQDIGDSQLVVFGNPKAGTPLMNENRLAGLYLPLKILVYEDAEGKVWVAHDDVTDRLDELDGLDDDAELMQPLQKALDALSQAAAGQAG